MSRRFLVASTVVVTAVSSLVLANWTAITGAEPATDPALQRTRREVRMLDDVYKTAIVLITKHYVEENSDLAAGQAFKALFGAMKEKGWHEVRLLDATGSPLEETNAPQDAFEKEAIKRLKANEPYYDQVVEKDGKRYLRAATPIPVVMDKCVLCHENYRGNKGVIGSLAYTLPIE